MHFQIIKISSSLCLKCKEECWKIFESEELRKLSWYSLFLYMHYFLWNTCLPQSSISHNFSFMMQTNTSMPCFHTWLSSVLLRLETLEKRCWALVSSLPLMSSGWQISFRTRLGNKKGNKINKVMENGYSTILPIH